MIGWHRPNVVLVVLDDSSKDEMYAGGSYATTPNLDALAATGVKYRTVWGAPVCGATRAILHAGITYLRTGVLSHLGTSAVFYETFLNTLRGSGIQVGVIGKGGIGGPTTMRWSGLGATRYIGHLGAFVSDHDEWDLVDATFDRNGLTTERIDTSLSSGSPSTIYDTYNTGYYTADVITSAALQTMAAFEAAQPGKPWFLEVSYPTPSHLPLQAPPGGSCDDDSEDCLDEVLEYWDDHLQALVDAVELSSTVFFILNDNGPILRPVDVRGCKFTVHECGISLPLIVFGGGIAAAADIGGLHSVADLAITIPELLGAAVPAGAVDGCSLLPVLLPDGGWSGCTHTYLYSAAMGVGTTLRRADGYKLDVLDDETEELYKVDNTGFGEDEGANLCTGDCPGGLAGADLDAYNALKAESDSL